MKTNIMKRLMIAGILFLGIVATGSTLAAQPRFSVGIGIGAPGYYAPPPVYRPPYPGNGYYWVDGAYDPYGSWIPGYWAPPRYYRPYSYGYFAPRYYGGYYQGFRGGYGGYGRGYERRDFRGGGRDFRGGRR